MKSKIGYCYLFLIFTNSNVFSGSSKVIISAIPKCGTHLVRDCIREITGLQFQEVYQKNRKSTWINPSDEEGLLPFQWGHAVCSARNVNYVKFNNYKGIFIFRDPRDQCVSMIHFSRRRDQSAWPKLSASNFDEALLNWIADTSNLYSAGDVYWKDPLIKSFKGIDDLYGRYLGWMNDSCFYTTTFEKLVGPEGGGDRLSQVEEIMKIAQHIDYPISLDRAYKIANKLFGLKGTFRKGQIGSWKDHFSHEHKQLFKKVAGQLLIDLGYEQDNNW